MALSQSVTDSLEEAKSSLRNALAFAARNERPYVCSSIAKILNDVENVAATDSIFDSLDNMKKDGGSDDLGNLGFDFGK